MTKSSDFRSVLMAVSSVWKMFGSIVHKEESMHILLHPRRNGGENAKSAIISRYGACRRRRARGRLSVNAIAIERRDV